MKTRLLVTVAVLGVAGLLTGVWAQGRTETIAYMRQKLILSQGVLEGLTLEDYNLVATNSVKLRDMSANNLWLRIGHKEYNTMTVRYAAHLKDLREAAESENLRKATEAYHKVIESCVECHRWFRTSQRDATSSPAE